MTSRRRACQTGKRPYHDEAEAKAALTRVRQNTRDRRAVTPQRAYKCQFCNRWHLTSQAHK